MKDTELTLDAEILAPFQNIFKAMKLSQRRLELEALNLELPPLDSEIQYQLEYDGLATPEDFSFELPEILTPQLYLKYEQHPVIVYQREQILTQRDYEQGKLRPFHLCFCQALRDAHSKNRYEGRYVFTYNTSGNFKVSLRIRDKNSDGQVYTLKKEQDVRRRLKVCKHCLREINWHHFRSYCGGGLEWWRGGNSLMRNRIVDEFDLEEYLLTARRNNFLDHPVLGTAASSIGMDYVLSPQVKESLKEINDYTCEICHEQFPAAELEIHHRNHLPGDNRRENLMVVCHDCHALIHKAEGGWISRRKKSAANPASKELSSDDYAAAQKKLGDMYANGWGVPRDATKAQGFYKNAEWLYKKMSETGDADALFELKKFASAFEKYSELAVDGNVHAKIRIGLMYAKGLGVKKNLDAAKKIIESIKKNTDVGYSELVELCMLAGNIDDALKFHAKAVQLLEIAAEHGNAEAAFELTKLYSFKDLISRVNQNHVNKLFAQAASFFNQTASNHESDLREIVSAARVGNVEAILKLKNLAKSKSPEAESKWKSLFKYEFSPSTLLGNTLVFRDGIKRINANDFNRRDILKDIVFPAGLEEIGANAFYMCSKLTVISFPVGLKKNKPQCIFALRRSKGNFFRRRFGGLAITRFTPAPI